mmetsp:Transcript_55528/g.153711  ORF Transcript_55528/g.153711 Transcript_55528/m.153711 type:complete len:260 (+) Transcript_55528:186-965(+)
MRLPASALLVLTGLLQAAPEAPQGGEVAPGQDARAGSVRGPLLDAFSGAAAARVAAAAGRGVRRGGAAGPAQRVLAPVLPDLLGHAGRRVQRTGRRARTAITDTGPSGARLPGALRQFPLHLLDRAPQEQALQGRQGSCLVSRAARIAVPSALVPDGALGVVPLHSHERRSIHGAPAVAGGSGRRGAAGLRCVLPEHLRREPAPQRRRRGAAGGVLDQHVGASQAGDAGRCPVFLLVLPFPGPGKSVKRCTNFGATGIC